MRRLVATVLVQALVLTMATASSWHLHAYSDHDHPDHHHGPATHEHRATADAEPQAARSADKDSIRVETVPQDDAGRHALGFSTGATCGQRVEITVAIVPGPALMDAGAPTWSALAPTDVRAHGPPATVSTSPRAPPLLHLA